MLVLAVVGVGLMRSRPSTVPEAPQLVATGTPAPAASTGDPSGGRPADRTDSSTAGASRPSGAPEPLPASASPAVIRVHVIGRVARPGVHEVPVGARVVDAVDAAGGMTTGAHPGTLNLAQPVCDGCQVVIPAAGNGTLVPPAATGSAGSVAGAGTPQSAATGSGSAGAGPSDLVDLNTASQSQLEAIDGVGPVMAGRILAWRQQHGRFTKVDELQEIDGIGPKTFARLKDHVRI